jgi:hypothetical protein
VRANVEDAVSFPPGTPPHDFLTGVSEPPSPAESGWKDTFVAPPGKVTRVRIRFAPQYTKEADLVPGFNPFPFDSTAGPGYVWHCHILDHEDNDMMRPMKMTMPAATSVRLDRRPGTRSQPAPSPQPAIAAPAGATHHMEPAREKTRH